MKHYLVFSLFFLVLSASLFAQPLRVVRANSTRVDVRDGEELRKGYWQISPSVRPDVYTPDRLKKPRRIAFYTDVDSIGFTVAPGKAYDFIILYKGDSCFTRISGMAPPVAALKRDCGGCADESDSIPFTFGSDGKIYINVSINNSEPLNMMFDTGSNRNIISKSGQKKVKMSFDDTEQSIGFGGVALREKSNANRLRIGRLGWDSVPFLSIDKADGDGIIGYPVFDGQVVEINYDKKLLIVHTKDWAPAAGAYSRLPLKFKGGLSFIPGSLLLPNGAVSGDLEFDTGSNGSLWLNQGYAVEHALYDGLKKLSRTRSHGVGGHLIYNQKVLMPQLQLGNEILKEVPVDLELPSQTENLQWNILGMDILKRFNTVIDYRNDEIFIKSNSLFLDPYRNGMDIKLIFLLAAIAVLFIGGLILFIKRKRSAKRIR